jgi:hypothetical protein
MPHEWPSPQRTRFACDLGNRRLGVHSVAISNLRVASVKHRVGVSPDLRPYLRDGQADLAELVPYAENSAVSDWTRIGFGSPDRVDRQRWQSNANEFDRSVQMRVYRAIHFDLSGTGTHSQDFFEFRISGKGLLSGQGAGCEPLLRGKRNFRFSGRRETTCSRVRGRSPKARRVPFALEPDSPSPSGATVFNKTIEGGLA